jgi:transcriptional regulator with AAA-type ATPase domain
VNDDQSNHDTTSTLRLQGHGTSSASGSEGLVMLYAPRPTDVPSAIAIPEGGLVLGRDPPPGGLRLPFSSVSRVHAKVGRKGSQLVVEDLESRNGTFVNGRRIAAASLEEGDELRLGEILLKVVASGVEPYTEFPLTGIVPPWPTERLLGGYVMGKIREQVVKAGTGAQPVLVMGETGTGKELVAAAFHHASGRSGKLCAVNCAAIPASLLESELFGYTKGAFTGADGNRLGLVRSANQGTLFLDEIGDMPLEAQAKLLRLLETREVTPLGSHKSEHVDVRVVCATHRDLVAMVRTGKFRADLYARIAGYVIHLPPLRERKEDIVQLTKAFLESTGGGALEVRPAFVLGLLSHDWPFNVRELLSAVQRAVTLAEGVLDVAQLPQEIAAHFENPTAPAPRARAELESDDAAASRAAAPTEEELRALLVRHGGNVTAVARELAKDRTQIHRWLKRFGISLDEFRG